MVFNGVILGLICMDLLEGMEADLSLLEKFKKKNEGTIWWQNFSAMKSLDYSGFAAHMIYASLLDCISLLFS